MNKNTLVEEFLKLDEELEKESKEDIQHDDVKLHRFFNLIGTPEVQNYLGDEYHKDGGQFYIGDKVRSIKIHQTGWEEAIVVKYSGRPLIIVKPFNYFTDPNSTCVANEEEIERVK